MNLRPTQSDSASSPPESRYNLGESDCPIPVPRPFTVALAGTPNCGKTTLFNRISHLRHKVANYPGATVEKRSAIVRLGGREMEIVDLPGIYSLGTESQDELVTREFCLRQRPDLILAVLDATNLERGLYLLLQWLELGFPVLAALNLWDEAQALGLRIRVERLSQLLGVHIIPTVARTGEGLGALLKALEEAARNPAVPAFHLPLEPPVEDEVARLVPLLEQRDGSANRYPLDWVALKLLEGDSALAGELRVGGEADDLLAREIEAGANRLRALYGQPPAILLSARRHEYARDLVRQVVAVVPRRGPTRSDRIDRLLVSTWFGLPFFLVVTYLVFEFAFTVGRAPMAWIEAGVGALSAALMSMLPPGVLRSLIVDGVVGGVGGVIVFLPNILLLFIAMAILEDSGYMARGAAIMDRLMSRVGLHGKSFIPMMIGFGCNVPAIMAARTLENRRDRLITMLVLPMMSCGARLPVYVLFISAFFTRGAPVLFSIYLLGIFMAVISALVLRRIVFRGGRTPFVLELPPYRLPTLRSVLLHAWDHAWMYLKKAGTVILLLSVVVWFLSTYPRPPKTSDVRGPAALRYTVAGTVGSLIEPVLRPIGLGDWKVGVALVSGFAAKEVVVASFATLYNVGEAAERSSALRDALRRDPLWTPLSAYALMVFVLLYIPCLPAMVMLRRESGSRKWVALEIAYTTTLAYTVALIVYQGGKLLGWG
ncbi:MAG: ferrous iron transport protein B [Candidatus Sumerlaeia bacterium]|nr:ferrous iron transport protein B [Candidatus Sumerlaeia bacterium]